MGTMYVDHHGESNFINKTTGHTGNIIKKFFNIILIYLINHLYINRLIGIKLKGMERKRII